MPSSPPESIAQLLKQASDDLSAAGCDTPRLDAEVLLAHMLGKDRTWLYAHPRHELSPEQSEDFQSLLSRRIRREPVAYIVGHKEFFGLDFFITPAVLVPRPETELLVETALHVAKAFPPPLTIIDVGTGSGVIAVSLAAHMPQARIFASDTSSAALITARHNAACHGVGKRICFVQGDLLTPLTDSFHLVVANPPYLRQDEFVSAPPEVADWEPRTALDGGPDGLHVIRRLLAMASDRLHAKGALLVEIGAEQGAEALNLAGRHFPQADIKVTKDYTNRDRLLVIQLFAKALPM